MATDVVDIRLGVPEKGWTLAAGTGDDESLTLFIATDSGQYEVRIPIEVGPAGELIVGKPEVTEA